MRILTAHPIREVGWAIEFQLPTFLPTVLPLSNNQCVGSIDLLTDSSYWFEQEWVIAELRRLLQGGVRSGTALERQLDLVGDG